MKTYVRIALKCKVFNTISNRWQKKIVKKCEELAGLVSVRVLTWSSTNMKSKHQSVGAKQKPRDWKEEIESNINIWNKLEKDLEGRLKPLIITFTEIQENRIKSLVGKYPNSICQNINARFQALASAELILEDILHSFKGKISFPMVT